MPGGEDGEFEPELSSLFSGINLLYLLIWSCFKVKSSLSRADGSEEEEIFKTVSLVLPFTKKLASKRNNLQKFKYLGSCLRGMLKL